MSIEAAIKAVGASILVALASACQTAGDETTVQSAGSAAHAEAPILIVRPASSTRPSMMTELSGRLVQTGRCLFLVQDEYRWLMTWPTGSELRRRSDGSFEIVVPEQGGIPVGAEIVAEGGQLDGSTATTIFGVPIPENCRGPYWVTDPGGVRLRR
jgi:hypothetical protein